jgi:hypothetical protein
VAWAVPDESRHLVEQMGWYEAESDWTDQLRDLYPSTERTSTVHEGNVPTWDSASDASSLRDALHPAGCLCTDPACLQASLQQ